MGIIGTTDKRLVKCHLCGCSVRSDRLARHCQRAHSASLPIQPKSVIPRELDPNSLHYSRASVLRSPPHALPNIRASRLHFPIMSKEAFASASERIKRRTHLLAQWLPEFPERIVWDNGDRCHLRLRHDSLDVVFNEDDTWICKDPQTGLSLSSNKPFSAPVPQLPPSPQAIEARQPAQTTTSRPSTQPRQRSTLQNHGSGSTIMERAFYQSGSWRAGSTQERDVSSDYRDIRDFNGQFGSYPSHDDFD